MKRIIALMVLLVSCAVFTGCNESKPTDNTATPSTNAPAGGGTAPASTNTAK